MENNQINKELMQSNHDRNTRSITLKPMDLVMTKVTSIGRTESRKFASKWTGPHCVLRMLKHNGIDRAVEILDSDNFKVRRIPFGHIKEYCEPSLSSECHTLQGQVIQSHLGHSLQTPNSRSENCSPNRVQNSRRWTSPSKELRPGQPLIGEAREIIQDVMPGDSLATQEQGRHALNQQHAIERDLSTGRSDILSVSQAMLPAVGTVSARYNPIDDLPSDFASSCEHAGSVTTLSVHGVELSTDKSISQGSTPHSEKQTRETHIENNNNKSSPTISTLESLSYSTLTAKENGPQPEIQ